MNAEGPKQIAALVPRTAERLGERALANEKAAGREHREAVTFSGREGRVWAEAAMAPVHDNRGVPKRRRRLSACTPAEAARRRAENKTAHSQIEKKRRMKMNREFEALTFLIPACRDACALESAALTDNLSTSPGGAVRQKPEEPKASAMAEGAPGPDSLHKLTILQSAVSYISYLHRVIAAQHAEMDTENTRWSQFDVRFAGFHVPEGYRDVEKAFMGVAPSESPLPEPLPSELKPSESLTLGSNTLQTPPMGVNSAQGTLNALISGYPWTEHDPSKYNRERLGVNHPAQATLHQEPPIHRHESPRLVSSVKRVPKQCMPYRVLPGEGNLSVGIEDNRCLGKLASESTGAQGYKDCLEHPPCPLLNPPRTLSSLRTLPSPQITPTVTPVLAAIKNSAPHTVPPLHEFRLPVASLHYVISNLVLDRTHPDAGTMASPELGARSSSINSLLN